MNRKLLFPGLAILLLTTLFGFTTMAQISEGGIPASFTSSDLKEHYNVNTFAKPDLAQLMLEDQMNAESPYPGPERMACAVTVKLDLKKAGSRETLADGSTLWRLKIIVPDALALGICYSDFHLPTGSTLFLYNKSKTQVIGAFTSENNHESRLFANEFIQGDEVTLEYREEAGISGEAAVFISEVAYAYRFISFNYDGLQRDQSWPCMINVKCEEGNGWEDQMQGIARISLKAGAYWYWCSGSLINNTSNDRTPYFLTAEHCGEGASAGDMNQWLFYFNYQASYCSSNYGPSSNTTTGCSLKAKDVSGYDGSDFELVKLNTTPPSSYNVYYNGWNRTNVPADSGVGLHHPAGDIKKVSTYLDPMVSSLWWNGSPSHWRLSWSETVNGRSVMQGGSSGSPIFDQDHYIMGDLSGGTTSNSCETPSFAYYGKIWYSWDQNGSTPATRLKDWLDPTNTNKTKQMGLSSQILPPVVDFSVDTTYIKQGSTVHFTDLTTGNPAMSWDWSFPGGTPNASDIQNPTVTYNQYGVFDVTLTVENADGTDTETKVAYMTVEQVLAPETDFSASQVEITEGDMISFSDLSINEPTAWVWAFEGAEPDSSLEQNPDSIKYSIPGVYDVSLTASNFGGATTELKENFITVNTGLPPVTDFYADVTEILPGDSVNFFDLSVNNPTQWTWTFEGGVPGTSSNQNPTYIVYPNVGSYYVRLRTKNSFGNHTTQKDGYIVVGNVSIKERELSKGFVIFPNPSHGVITVDLAGGVGAWRSESKENSGTDVMLDVAVVNASGNMVKSLQHSATDRYMRIDLSDMPDGLYIVRISSGERSVQKKLSLLK